ncbi:MAG TPA: carboxymuconolactone decarboxylase family protein [Mycobacteriales bacterium]|nr:carboxymuconolactone decarboxylase family protein [Mycobacteriales bacterium]
MNPTVPLIDEPRGLLRRLAWRYSRKTFGKVVDPVRANAHHTGVLLASGALETAVAKRWRTLDQHLRWLAIQMTSTEIGCSWCTDYGYYLGMQSGVDPRKVTEVPHWRTSDVYDERERAVLEYAEAATRTPAAMTDELADRLRALFTDEEITELVAWVALENFRSRTNAGLGLRSEGFAATCAVPPAGLRVTA